MQRAHAWFFASLVAFIASLLALCILLFSANRMPVVLKSVFFLVIVPLGLCAAGFLFGALKSAAHFRGHAFGGVLDLGGPVVVFFIVILLGKWFAPADTLAVKVVIRGPVGKLADARVSFSAGSYYSTKNANADGEVTFDNIPTALRSENLEVRANLEDYVMITGTRQPFPESGFLKIDLEPAKQSCLAVGYLLWQSGAPVAGATLRFQASDRVYSTDGSGYFRIPVKRKCGLTVQVTAFLGENTVYESDQVTLPVEDSLPLRLTSKLHESA